MLSLDVTSTSNDIESDQQGALTFYAGTSDGLWRTDRSQRDPTELGVWETNDRNEGGSGKALAVSPNFANDGMALIGTWGTYYHTVVEQYGSGILKSTDWGQSWSVKLRSAHSLLQHRRSCLRLLAGLRRRPHRLRGDVGRTVQINGRRRKLAVAQS